MTRAGGKALAGAKTLAGAEALTGGKALAGGHGLGSGRGVLRVIQHQIAGNPQGCADGNGHHGQKSKQQRTGQHQMCHLVGSGCRSLEP